MKNTLIIVVGPTAIGKTKVGIALAKALKGEIISADSRQFYHELKIGVAAPTSDEKKAVPHHFVGHLSVTDPYNVSRFENDVLEFLQLYFQDHEFAVMVGGSGLYIDAICKGIDDFPDPENGVRQSLKNLLEQDGIEVLRQQLKKVDPHYYQVVDLNNPNRILRALEVWQSTGKPYSEQRKNPQKTRPFRIIKIGLNRPRAELVNIIHQRVDDMIKSGLIEEVQSLVNFRNENALNTVGYKEVFKFLDGDWTLELAIEKIKTNTRRYAKRQITWFKRDEEIRWFHPDQTEEILEYIQGLS